MSWLRNNRWKATRRVVQILVVAVLLSPALGLEFFRGTLISGELFGVTLNDPLAAADYALAAKNVSAAVLLGALIVLAFYYLVGGRVFCSWVCPVHLVSEIGGCIRGKTPLLRLAAPSATKYWVLVVILVLAATTSRPVFEMVSPIGAVTQNLALGFTAPSALNASLLLVLLVFLVEVLGGKGWWCGQSCPVAAVYALIGRRSPARIRINHEACDNCGECFRACMVPDVLISPVNGETRWVLSGDCSNCMNCVDTCPQKALDLRFSFAGRK